MLVLMAPLSFVPRLKLELRNIANCDAIKTTLVLIYSFGEQWGMLERRTLRIRVVFPEGTDEAVRAASRVLKREI